MFQAPIFTGRRRFSPFGQRKRAGGLISSVVSYWKLGELGGQRNDAKGSNHLTDNNTVLYATGKRGNAALFDSANSEYLSIADNATLRVTGSATWWGWARLDDKTTTRILLHKGALTAANCGYRIDYAQGTDRLRFSMADGTNLRMVSADVFGSPPEDTWFFFCARYDASTRLLTFSINGGAADTTTALATDPVSTANPLVIGAQSNTSAQHWHGAIDEVGFANRVLTAAEEAQLYNSGAGLALFGGDAINFSRVQSANSDADPASATFAATPTEGNLLVAIATARDGISHSAFTISGSGWTKQIGRDVNISDGTARITAVVWTKVAGAAEPTNIQVDNGSANGKRVVIQEFSPGTSGVTWALVGSASNDNGTSSVSPCNTGSTASLAADDLLVIAYCAWRPEATDVSGVSWDNVSNTIQHGAASGRTINIGWAQTATGGVKTATVSWSAGTSPEPNAGILVFSANS